MRADRSGPGHAVHLRCVRSDGPPRDYAAAEAEIHDEATARNMRRAGEPATPACRACSWATAAIGALVLVDIIWRLI